jgi:hypothetical protein
MVFYYRGIVERGWVTKRWRYAPGYSGVGPTGGVAYPWMTRRECQMVAKRDGYRAVFK